jgi:hypothetical protein
MAHLPAEYALGKFDLNDTPASSHPDATATTSDTCNEGS